MIPDPPQEQNAPPQPSNISAHIFHRTLLEFLAKDPKYRDIKKKEQINKLLIDYAYRGSNIIYVSGYV